MNTHLGRISPVTLVLGGLLMFAVLFQIAELVTGSPDGRTTERRPEEATVPAKPICVEIHKLGGNGYQIDIGGSRHTVLRLERGETGRIDEIIACV